MVWRFFFVWDGWFRTVVDGRKCTCVMLAIVCFGVVFFPMHSCIRWSSCIGIRSFVRVEFSIDRSPRCLDASSADVDLSRPFFPPSFSSEGIPSILVSISFPSNGVGFEKERKWKKRWTRHPIPSFPSHPLSMGWGMGSVLPGSPSFRRRSRPGAIVTTRKRHLASVEVEDPSTRDTRCKTNKKKKETTID